MNQETGACPPGTYILGLSTSPNPNPTQTHTIPSSYLMLLLFDKMGWQVYVVLSRASIESVAVNMGQIADDGLHDHSLQVRVEGVSTQA